jgi:hypothetical protein
MIKVYFKCIMSSNCSKKQVLHQVASRKDMFGSVVGVVCVKLELKFLQIFRLTDPTATEVTRASLRLCCIDCQAF